MLSFRVEERIAQSLQRTVGKRLARGKEQADSTRRERRNRHRLERLTVTGGIDEIEGPSRVGSRGVCEAIKQQLGSLSSSENDQCEGLLGKDTGQRGKVWAHHAN